MPAAAVHKAQKKVARKPTFQADLAPLEDRMVRSLKEELQISSNSDFMADAVALFRWAVAERTRGHRILSESTTGEKQILGLPGWKELPRKLRCRLYALLGTKPN